MIFPPPFMFFCTFIFNVDKKFTHFILLYLLILYYSSFFSSENYIKKWMYIIKQKNSVINVAVMMLKQKNQQSSTIHCSVYNHIFICTHTHSNAKMLLKLVANCWQKQSEFLANWLLWQNSHCNIHKVTFVWFQPSLVRASSFLIKK